MKIGIALLVIAIGATLLFFSMRNQTMNTSHVKTPLERNEEAFANMREKTKWNLEADMLWGFFFTNPTKEPLVPVSEQLRKSGYRVVNIYEDDAKENWWLHVEKVEVHTPVSLAKRGEELETFAANAGLGSYDGWDVDPVLESNKTNER